MERPNIATERLPLWLDCDPGHDDAFAILFAAYHPNLELLGISTVYGNAPLSKTTNNTLRILEAIGKPEIAVFPGALKPFCRLAKAAPEIHGESGLDGTDLLPNSSRSALQHCNAVCEMKQRILSCPRNTCWIVATGSLTNVALLFAVFPEVAHHIKGLSIMGGAIGDGFTSVSMGPDYIDSEGKSHSRIGNKTPYAEFNIWCDPESAQSVFQNPILQRKTILIPLDLTHQASANESIRDLLLHGSRGQTRLRRMFNELLMFFAQTYEKEFGLSEGPPLHDPLAVAVLLSHEASDPNLGYHHGEKETWEINVLLEGEQLGRTIAVKSPTGTIIPRGFGLDHFWSELNECLEKADMATSYRSM